MRPLQPLVRIGEASLGLAELTGRAAIFGWRTARSLTDVRTWAPVALVQARRIGVDSLPVALFIALFTGVVLALQSSYTFTGVVPLYFVGTLVGKSVILELGPVITSLALAGRVGANIAAELGTMRVTEQIDALEMLAYDPFAYLVAPRVVAGTVTFPLIVAFAVATGIASGWLASVQLLHLSTQEFVRGLQLYFKPFDVEFALLKSASFGLAITGISALYGFRTRRGAEGVGQAATRSVVGGCMMVLLLDAAWAMWLL